jgi:microcystin degradation protein MlrC
MVVGDRTDDGDGPLLQKIRAIASRTPIAVSLDLHANVTSQMVRNCDAIAGYKTYPHVDGYEAGRLAGTIVLRYLKGEVTPVMAWGSVPLLAQTLRQNTDESLMKDCVMPPALRRRTACCDGLRRLVMADIHDAGLSVITVADGDWRKAEESCRAILDIARRHKDDFIYRGEPPQRAITRAKHMAEESGGPILLLDHADNCASGATQDTMYAAGRLPALPASQWARCATPEAVAMTPPAWARRSLETGRQAGHARDQEGRTAERTERSAPSPTANTPSPGRSSRACVATGRTPGVDTGTAEIVVTERNQEPWDRAVFTSVGIDPTRKRFLLLKSRMYFRPVFLPIASGMVYCDSLGVGSSDWKLFDYRKLRRPIYPLDSDFPAEHR